jgi:pimeloyl-ACP methyl ester carboxylesterase
MSVTYRVPRAILTEREHTVPLDHAAADGRPGRTLSVFTREVAAPDGGEDRPYLLFLQGGPGIEATRPTSPPTGWMKRALQDYRVLLMDQRGTGRSTPVGAEIPGDTAAAQAEYLTHFRADSIVRDAELIRQNLGVERWSVLGQSFGGFTSMTYLSIAPEGLREAFITGGLSPIGRPVDDIYGATYVRLGERNRLYFDRYPDDRARAREIFRRLDEEDVRLPSGDRLTARRFRQLGLWLGDSAGFELLHHVLELPFGSNAFLYDAEVGAAKFGRNPIYATLHESSYADGVPTRWSSDRLLPAEVQEEGWFTAEHVFPWMWEDYAALASHRPAAHLVAEHEWPRLYDADRLRHNEVPVAATIYVNDLYVDRDFAQETARTIRGLKPWITNEYEHNGIRADGERVLGRLIDMVRGRV